jgi:hypothetical protein
MDPDERAGREATLERLQLAMNDMSDVVWTVVSLRDGNLNPRIRRVVVTGIFATYARAFNKSEGNAERRALPPAPTKVLSTEQREIHQWALAERDEIWAHVDRSQERRKTSVQRGNDDLPHAFVEEYLPPSQERLEALREIAHELGKDFRKRADEQHRALAESDGTTGDLS